MSTYFLRAAELDVVIVRPGGKPERGLTLGSAESIIKDGIQVTNLAGFTASEAKRFELETPLRFKQTALHAEEEGRYGILEGDVLVVNYDTVERKDYNIRIITEIRPPRSSHSILHFVIEEDLV